MYSNPNCSPGIRRESRVTEHEIVVLTSSPDDSYVYHVKHRDYDGLVDALKQAMSTPIPRTVLPLMTQVEHEKRMRALVETDWHAEAIEELASRRESGGKVGRGANVLF